MKTNHEANSLGTAGIAGAFLATTSLWFAPVAPRRVTNDSQTTEAQQRALVRLFKGVVRRLNGGQSGIASPEPAEGNRRPLPCQSGVIMYFQ